MFSRISAGSLSSSPRQAAMRQALPLLAAQASCRIAGAALRARRPLGGESTAFRRAFGNSNPLSTEFLYRDQGFAVVGDTPVTDTTASMFTVSVRNGFLPREVRFAVPISRTARRVGSLLPLFCFLQPALSPRPPQDPLVQLPEAYTALESLLQRMPLVLPDGRPGLLSLGDFGKAIDDELPLYDVSKVEDARLLSGLFRDYTFAASAYLLEPCDLRYKATRKDYGLGRDKLPKNIAIPLILQKLDFKTTSYQSGGVGGGCAPLPLRFPVEYAHSYALYNYKRINCSRGLDYDNLELIRRFSGSAAEHGFILVHVAMARHSGDLLRACMDVLRGAGAKDRQAFDGALRDMRVVYQRINDVMETMWEKSDPEQYLDFRTFIMGTKNQPMFPKGVAFQGVGERGEDVVMFHRGESGANDSMIPLGDNLLQVTFARTATFVEQERKKRKSVLQKNY
ncbi:MAG: hypothetical protein BJ554DRAFT_2635 [Olpidium bornovanus]|uniref:Uncharacterized protein n=1 Tax=Olpidium bornovanus TaxID=278681 RepID=A0A8H7ZQK7_9FUNG|nr:MAG: hypothetical protein BJ554DRAFT_2635 [Olpidium bornovanus]